MNREFTAVAFVLVFVLGGVFGFFLRGFTGSPVANRGEEGGREDLRGPGQAAPRLASATPLETPADEPPPDPPSRSSARAYAIEFVRRALDDRRTNDIAFSNLRVRSDGENAWRVEGVFRPDDAYEFGCRVWAVQYEGRWIWSCRDLTIGDRAFPDEINFQDNSLP